MEAEMPNVSGFKAINNNSKIIVSDLTFIKKILLKSRKFTIFALIYQSEIENRK